MTSINKPIIVVGCGIAGTLVSFQLWKHNIPFVVFAGEESASKMKASFAASALINPVTEHKFHTALNYEKYISIASETYRELEQLLDIQVLQTIENWVIHPNNVRKQVFMSSESPYLIKTSKPTPAYINAPFDIGEIKPLYKVNQQFINKWIQFLASQNKFHWHEFDINNGVKAVDQIIIDCTGAAQRNNRLYNSLKFNADRGDVLIVHSDINIAQCVYSFGGIKLVPMQNQLYWLGSNHIWQFDNCAPDIEWKLSAINKLKNTFNIPFTEVGHFAAERPVLAGQQPLVFQHPEYVNLLAMIGLGTRGFSSGPFYSLQLVNKLLIQP